MYCTARYSPIGKCCSQPSQLCCCRTPCWHLLCGSDLLHILDKPGEDLGQGVIARILNAALLALIFHNSCNCRVVHERDGWEQMVLNLQASRHGLSAAGCCYCNRNVNSLSGAWEANKVKQVCADLELSAASTASASCTSHVQGLGFHLQVKPSCHEVADYSTPVCTCEHLLQAPVTLIKLLIKSSLHMSGCKHTIEQASR